MTEKSDHVDDDDIPSSTTIVTSSSNGHEDATATAAPSSTTEEAISSTSSTPSSTLTSRSEAGAKAEDAPTGTDRPSPPNRNPSTDSLRSVPLPSIRECLFGIPREEEEEDDDDDITKDDMQYLVPLNLLRRVSSQGIDDDDERGHSHRALAWRVLLGYLPADRRQWTQVAQRQRQSYRAFTRELFCLRAADVCGSTLRGHHSKRVSNRKQQQQHKKDQSKQAKQERRHARRLEKQQQSQQQQEEEEDNTNHRAPIKFMEELPRSLSIDSTVSAESDLGDHNNDNNNNNNNSTTTEDDNRLQLSCQDVLQDDPTARWNMSVREQKILERLTNHDATNQLLVKRDCQEWNNFLENATLLDEIRKDVNRTHPHLLFYLEPQQQLGARRYGALERILFVWAKLNKGVRYVQGMNEIVGTLYYVLANDFHEEWADHAEADTYILFNIIMSEMRDIFVADLDTADTGIVGRIDNMQNLLHLHDPQVKGHLDDMGIDASFYAVRWLTTLLSREFLLPDTIRLWDSMFASTHKENFLRYVCVTMVLKIRDQLLKADFATCLQLLQKYPSSSMDDLLDCSRALWIYESQITMACLKGGLTLHQALQAVPPPDRVIMAFGLRGGIAVTNREQLEKARARAKEAVRNNADRARQGMQTVAHAGQGILGGARRFIRGRMQQRAEASSVEEFTGASASAHGAHGAPPQRNVFRNFSFGGRAVSDGIVEENKDDGTSDNQDILQSHSDAETV